MGYTTTNPYTNEVVKTFPYATDAEEDAALDKAHAAFLSWRTTSFNERSLVLLKAADVARARREELARLNTLEMGKLFTEALWEVEIIAQIFEYYAKHGDRLLAPERLSVDDPAEGSAVLVYQPLGIVFEIEPWNVPFFQVVRPLELGGSDVMIVLGDADRDQAVQGAILGRLTLSGQACVGDKRMMIADSLYDVFVIRLTAAVLALHPGDPMDPSTTLAPVSAQAAADTIKERIRQAVAHGASATPIGEPVPAQGAFVQPTILTGVTEDNPVYTQEIFGPVLMLFRFRDEAEAIRLANNTPFGLGASVYSTNLAHAFAVAEQLEAGAVTIHQPTLPSPSIPFGGVKNSGYGRELGADGIREFMNHKVINGARVAEVA